MHAAFIFEAAERAASSDGEHGLLDPADFSIVYAEHGGGQPVPLGITQIHAHQHGGEQAGLVAARARAHLQDDVAVVVRIAGNQVQQKRLLQRRNLRFQTLQLLAGGFAQLWILG